MKNLYDGLDGYLTAPAKEAKEKMIEAGLDPDLAHTLIEITIPETQVYDLGDDQNGPTRS